jgi:MerR family transcriptional regulator, light-induced transcriptional regulator
MTAYRYVRTGKLPAAWVEGAWRVAPADLDVARASYDRRARVAGTGKRPSNQAPSHRARLLGRLVAGDEPGAWALVEELLGQSMVPSEVVLELISPSLADIGDGWAAGRLTVADEHRATAVCARLISRLGARFARRGVKRGPVVLAAPSGELHALPVAMAANLLRWENFDVIELGADTPACALAQEATRAGLLAVAVGCTTAAAETAAGEAVMAVREADRKVPVVLGGAGIDDAGQARRLGADAYSGRRADRLVAIIKELASERA